MLTIDDFAIRKGDTDQRRLRTGSWNVGQRSPAVEQLRPLSRVLRACNLPVGDLNEVAGSEPLTFLGAQHEKSVDCPFHVTHGDLFRLQRAGLEQRGTKQQADEQPGVDKL